MAARKRGSPLEGGREKASSGPLAGGREKASGCGKEAGGSSLDVHSGRGGHSQRSSAQGEGLVACC